MGKHNRPDAPAILKRIIEICDLPTDKKDSLQRMNRDQLVNLHIYITELKRTNEELSKKIDELHQPGNGDTSGEIKRSSES